MSGHSFQKHTAEIWKMKGVEILHPEVQISIPLLCQNNPYYFIVISRKLFSEIRGCQEPVLSTWQKLLTVLHREAMLCKILVENHWLRSSTNEDSKVNFPLSPIFQQVWQCQPMYLAGWDINHNFGRT